MEDDALIKELRRLFKKGWKNPSACALAVFYLGFDGKFTEIRKIAETQYQLYTMEVARSKNGSDARVG